MIRRVSPREEAHLRLAIAAREGDLAAELLEPQRGATQQELIQMRADIERLRSELPGGRHAN